MTDARPAEAAPTGPAIIHLVPHTHWDREWYEPFQVFRMRLVAWRSGRGRGRGPQGGPAGRRRHESSFGTADVGSERAAASGSVS
jgi:hypothetical protein